MLKKWSQDPHFGQLFSTKIDPRMRNAGSYIGKKIITIFKHIFLWFLIHFTTHGALKNSYFFIKVCSGSRFCSILAPRGCPKSFKTVSDTDFSWLWYHFGAICLGMFYLFYFVCNIISYFSPIQRCTNTPNNTDTPIHRYTNYTSIMHRYYFDNTFIHQ